MDPGPRAPIAASRFKRETQTEAKRCRREDEIHDLQTRAQLWRNQYRDRIERDWIVRPAEGRYVIVKIIDYRV